MLRNKRIVLSVIIFISTSPGRPLYTSLFNIQYSEISSAQSVVYLKLCLSNFHLRAIHRELVEVGYLSEEDVVDCMEC